MVNQIGDNVEVCRHADFRLFSVQMGYFRRNIDPTKTSNHELDKDVDSRIMSGLTDDDKLQDVKIIGAIVHPLFQSNLRMVSADL